MFQKGKEKKTGSMGNERERGKPKVNPVEGVEDETKNGYQKKKKTDKRKSDRERPFFLGNL